MTGELVNFYNTHNINPYIVACRLPCRRNVGSGKIHADSFGRATSWSTNTTLVRSNHTNDHRYGTGSRTGQHQYDDRHGCVPSWNCRMVMNISLISLIDKQHNTTTMTNAALILMATGEPPHQHYRTATMTTNVAMICNGNGRATKPTPHSDDDECSFELLWLRESHSTATGSRQHSDRIVQLHVTPNDRQLHSFKSDSEKNRQLFKGRCVLLRWWTATDDVRRQTKKACGYGRAHFLQFQGGLMKNWTSFNDLFLDVLFTMVGLRMQNLKATGVVFI